MVNLYQRSLFEMCGIQIAYLMWTRRDVTENPTKENLFDELIAVVLSDVKELCLPEKLKMFIFKQVEPTGKHLIALLSLWIFAQPENSPKWLTGDIILECLVLNTDGLINQRKTAEKILSKRQFDKACALRLACINFLENEVLKLWVLVREYFVKKIILEIEWGKTVMERNPSEGDIDSDDEHSFDIHEYAYECLEGVTCCCQSPSTTEREEVLFWIGYCIAKENGISITAIPHFLGGNYDWYAFSLEFAAFSGNAACFEYFKNSCDTKIEYNCVNMIRKIFFSHEGGAIEHPCFNRQLPCFVFYYDLLKCEEKAQLFQNSPSYMLFYFLQWPLSLTLLDNLEEIWNLVKHCILEVDPIIELFSDNILRLPETYSLFRIPSFNIIAGIYCTEHLNQIWIALWNISLFSSKINFLNLYVFKSFRLQEHQQQFYANFATSGFKDKLLQLFLSNGEAILEFYENKELKNSLRNLVAKYMPEHYSKLDSKCISYLADSTETAETKEQFSRLYSYEKRCTGRIHNLFLNYLKEYAFSGFRD